MENRNFTWVPFYKELAEKLLACKDNRKPLVDFIYSNDGLSAYVDYLHNEDKTKFNDIDPFSFFAIFNRQIGNDTRSKIISLIKRHFDIKADVPDDYNGIPVVNNQRSFFIHWGDLFSESCNRIWSLFISFMGGATFDKEFNALMNSKGIGIAMATMPLFWIKPEKYLALDSNNKRYLRRCGVESALVNDYSSYMSLLDDVSNKIKAREIDSNSFLDFSYNAWILNDEKSYFLAGYSFGSNDSQFERFVTNGIWEGSGNKKVNDLIQNLRVDDVLILKSSSTKGAKHDMPFLRISAIGIVQSVPEKLENSEHFSCNVKYIKGPSKDFEGSKYGKFRQTLHECFEKEIIDFVNSVVNTAMIPSEIQQYADILRIKKNLILQGAPGTGKTYNTASIALAICGQTDVDLSDHTAVMERYEKLRSEHQIEFVTFHQSMDYEDFVEGIKPKVCDDNSMVYEVEDGIFKEISDKALQNQIDSKKTKQVLQQEKSIEEKLFAFLDDAISEGKVYKTKADSEFVITSYNEKSINFYNEKNPKTKDVSASIKETIAILNSDLKLEQVSEIKQFFGRKNGQQSDSYLYKICNDIRSAVTKTVDVQLVKYQNYVLIIDEINRGNVSKIFGELITLLEADKRIGSDHPITLALPYSKEQFGVPANLYIIGTMNTTDRSVGNIDYAVRRRFAFATLKSDKSVLSEKYGVDSVNVRLYEAVEKFINANLPNGKMGIDDLMVGHSYFMAEYEEDLQLKWKFEILPLLNEYCKDGIINKGVGNDVTIDDFLKLWQSANKSNAEAL